MCTSMMQIDTKLLKSISDLLPLSQNTCYSSLLIFFLKYLSFSLPDTPLSLPKTSLYLFPPCFLCTHLFHLSLIPVSGTIVTSKLGRREYLIVLSEQLCVASISCHFPCSFVQLVHLNLIDCLTPLGQPEFDWNQQPSVHYL
jgi:hypothetical protein